MDVRCEKCLTVYELDDAKVGDTGLTVKCQECGYLFKVRRRYDTAELVITPPLGDPNAARAGSIEVKAPGKTPSREDSASALTAVASKGTALARAAGAVPGQAGGKTDDRGWMLRSAKSGEVARFRELTTLQQWIVERKVSRDDQISRGGETWKALGSIAELASFFHVVEQAEAVARASQPGLAVLRAGRGEPGSTGSEVDPAQLAAMPTDQLQRAPRDEQRPNERTGPSEFGGAVDDTVVEERTHVVGSERAGRGRGVFWSLGTVAALGLGGFLWMRAHDGAQKDGASGSGAAAEAIAELTQRGHTALLLDTDDGFRQAISALDRALELDGGPGGAGASGASGAGPGGGALLARVDLAEAHVTWAAYLGEDAHHIESAGGAGAAGAQAARTLRAEAQAHLERARRILEEPTGTEAAASPALARAFADLLRVEGAPAPAVERYLQRAAQRSANDPEVAYVAGELALREGKNQEALNQLGEAVRLGRESGAPRARAHYRLAALALAAGRKADAARECEALFKISSKHDRGHALCTFDTPDLASPVAVAVAAGAAAAPATPANEPAVAPPPPGPGQTSKSHESLAPPLPSDYKQLVREGDRLAESGRSVQARKLYERALEADPKGIGALTGLGYCDLDSERFLQAVDRFNAALSIDHSAGDALLGLAESYKVRGQPARAIEFYKKYLTSHPGGPKASLAQKNLHDLEAKLEKEAADTDRLSDKMTIRAQDKPSEKAPEKESGKEASKDPGEVALPKPPPEEP